MYLTSRRGLKLDGRNPTYLYGYGGFGISVTPSYSPATIVWLEMGGVYAQPCLRGGGEYGEAWHRAGMNLKKQNVFEDLYAAAKWLIDTHYTSNTKLAVGGSSNGGLVAGVAITQHPELFGAALIDVGVLDMLRFDQLGIGGAWAEEYGSPKKRDEFENLLSYSPLHNIRNGVRYPATLITTADHDDRVSPAHSFKFAAALQNASNAHRPILLRVESDAGHGDQTTTSIAIDAVTDQWSFLFKVLGMQLTNGFDFNQTAPAV